MHLYLKYQSLNTFGLKDVVQIKVSNICQNSRSQGQTSWYQKKGFFIMHLYLEYQSPNTFGSKDIAQVKFFKSRSKIKVKSLGTKRKVCS
jgi:hypothetical protein